MKRLWLGGLLLLCLTLGAKAQTQPQINATGTAHGVEATWTLSTSTTAGQYVWRCLGTCTTTSTTWTMIQQLGAAQTAYLDPAAGLTVNTTYSYAVQAFDTNGNQSSFSNVAVVVTPSTFPTNPQAHTGLTLKVQ